MSSSDLGPVISDAAQKPASASGDGQSVTQHPLPNLIEADRYVKGQQAATRRRRGLRFSKIEPPGATS